MHIVQKAPPAGDLAAVAEVMGKRYHHLQVLTDSTLSGYIRRKKRVIWAAVQRLLQAAAVGDKLEVCWRYSDGRQIRTWRGTVTALVTEGVVAGPCKTSQTLVQRAWTKPLSKESTKKSRLISAPFLEIARRS
jgi:hypothetical protein